jgi:hypothetical protein
MFDPVILYITVDFAMPASQNSVLMFHPCSLVKDESNKKSDDFWLFSE